MASNRQIWLCLKQLIHHFSPSTLGTAAVPLSVQDPGENKGERWQTRLTILCSTYAMIKRGVSFRRQNHTGSLENTSLGPGRSSTNGWQSWRHSYIDGSTIYSTPAYPQSRARSIRRPETRSTRSGGSNMLVSISSRLISTTAWREMMTRWMIPPNTCSLELRSM
jgi:hypothetical protein